MEVTVQDNLPFFAHLSAHLFNFPNLRKDSLHWSFPPSVEIGPGQRTSVVTVNYTVDVEHWDEFKVEFVTEDASLRCIWRQIIDYTLHHKGAVRLTGVDTRWYENAFPSQFLFISALSSYCKNVALVSSESATQHCLLHVLTLAPVLSNIAQLPV